MNVADSLEVVKFVKAMGVKDVKTAYDVFRAGGATVQKNCGERMVRIEEPKLVELFRGTTQLDIKEWILEVIFAHGGEQLLNNALKTLKPDDVLLSCAMGSAQLACNTTRFIDLLGRIKRKEDQERAVSGGVNALVKANEPKCFDSLISALRREPTLGPRFVNVAIGEAFYEASSYNDERSSFARRLFGHPAVSKRTYSTALYNSYNRDDPKNELFYWLLARVSPQVLKKVKEDPVFFYTEPEFQEAVNYVFNLAPPEIREEYERRRRHQLLTDAIGDYVANDYVVDVLVKGILEYC